MITIITVGLLLTVNRDLVRVYDALSNLFFGGQTGLCKY